VTDDQRPGAEVVRLPIPIRPLRLAPPAGPLTANQVRLGVVREALLKIIAAPDIVESKRIAIAALIATEED